jgi:hypothetical protein
MIKIRTNGAYFNTETKKFVSKPVYTEDGILHGFVLSDKNL